MNRTLFVLATSILSAAAVSASPRSEFVRDPAAPKTGAEPVRTDRPRPETAAAGFSERSAPPVQFSDSCSSAPSVSEGAYSYWTVTFGAAGPRPSCASSIYPFDIYDGWLLYSPSANGVATFSNAPCSTAAPGGGVGVGFGAHIAVWDGSTCPPTLLLGCSSAAPCASGYAELAVGVCAGGLYYVQIGNVGLPVPLTGAVAIALDSSGPTAAPGDHPWVAVTHPLGAAVPYNSIGFTTAGPTVACAGFAGANVFDFWFQFVAPTTGTAIASTCGSSVLAPGGGASPPNTYLGAFSGSSCGLPNAAVACSNGSPNCGLAEAEVAFSVTAGETYFVSVGTWGSPPSPNVGALSVALVPVPANDDCVNATPISAGLTVGTTIAAQTASTNAPCGMTNEVWFSFVVPCDGGRLLVDTCGSSSETTVAVFGACGGAPLGCAYQPASAGNCPTYSPARIANPLGVSVPGLSAGQTVVIAVGGWMGQTGPFILRVSCEYVHRWSTPAGPGSLRLENANGPPNAYSYSAITFNFLHPGLPPSQTFPYGAFFGVPMDVAEVYTQATWPGGLPFVGTLDGAGHLSNLLLPAGATAGLTGAATIWSVGVAFDPLTGFATIGDITRPTAFPL